MVTTRLLKVLLFFVSVLHVYAQDMEEVYPYRVNSSGVNEMQVINLNTAALYERIEMIRRAEKTLELEYFIFNPDTAGRIIAKELVKASTRGVKVRLLIDKSGAVFKLHEHYANVLGEQGIELRYYNPAPMIQISSTQFRNHRKLVIVDGQEAITGGRNIADEYFSLSTSLNFLDRDIWVKGEIVKAMKESFDRYWNSNMVQIPKRPEMPKRLFKYKSPNSENEVDPMQETAYQLELRDYQLKSQDAQAFLAPNEADDKVLDYVYANGERMLSVTNKYLCPKATFATDREGGRFSERLDSKNYHRNFRLLRKEIGKRMKDVETEVIIDSPYFLDNSRSKQVFADLIKDKKVTIFTNSLASTDAIYVATVFARIIKRYAKEENFNAYMYKGTFSGESDLYSDEIRNSTWGTHSKSMVFKDDSFMVGTFNIDNRSDFYNSEMALFCEGSPELTKDVKENIELRMKNAYHLDKSGKPDDGSSVTEGASLGKTLFFYGIRDISDWLEFLL